MANSDLRIKTVTGDYASGLAQITALVPKRFTYKGNDTLEPPVTLERSETRVPGAPPPAPLPPQAPYDNSPHYAAALNGSVQIGLIAQELETAFPELVTQSAGFIDGAAVTDLRSVDPGPLIFALINAVKELKAEVDALKAGA